MRTNRERTSSNRVSTGTERKTERGGAAGDQERVVESVREPGVGISLTRDRWPAVYEGQFSPFSLMRHLTEDLDRLFSGFGAENARLSPFGGGLTAISPVSGWSPRIDMFERDNKVILRADLPGLKKEDVNITVDDGILAIEGERKHEVEDAREGVYRSERSYGKFFRSIPLPEGIDADQVDARFTDGVLEISMPTPPRETGRGRKIEIH